MEAPYDRWAEESVVGCAIASRRGADLAAYQVNPPDFYNPKHARLFAAAVELNASRDEDLSVIVAAMANATVLHTALCGCVICGAPLEDDIRSAVVAERTGVELEEVTRLVRERPVVYDTNGRFAARVIDAAVRRRVMTAAATVYNALGTGARLEELRPALSVLGVSA
ncbi:MAG TPA: DnaB-like helicase N-terminal domain-containing protein [Acidimicrobiales bacterium]|nr:DnaB-like helicase N-terminal domain-containing protein [Acidimicrobiales bacterium]